MNVAYETILKRLESGEVLTVSGDALRWLDTQRVNIRRAPVAQDYAGVVLTYRVYLGMPTPDELWSAWSHRGAHRWFVGTWGDWLEAAEQQHQRETRTIQCGWCSHFTPKNRRDWHKVRCEQCGHGVDGSN